MGEDSNFDREIIDRLARIETKLDNVKETEHKAELAHEKATEAYNIAMVNSKEIASLQSNGQWLWRTVGGSLLVAFVTALLSLM